MDLDTFYGYLDCIPSLTSQEILDNLTVSDWPHIGKKDRVSLHKKIYKSAYPKTFDEPRRATLADVARILSGRR